jgi:hypothetical protein
MSAELKNKCILIKERNKPSVSRSYGGLMQLVCYVKADMLLCRDIIISNKKKIDNKIYQKDRKLNIKLNNNRAKQYRF